jgi:hypothetical protein
MKRIMWGASALTLWAALQPCMLRAEHTRIWKQADYSSFSKGTAYGVALTSDGKLAPAPRLTAFVDPNLAFVWAMTEDASGNVYVAGGANAKVLRVDAHGASTIVFESEDLSAQALVADKSGNLYVGTSPDGKVYRVTSDGESRVFFDPKAKYVWALLLAPDGTLFVATGNKGQVFAVAPDGKARLFYQSPQRHIRTLTFDSAGNLLIGTEPAGTIARIQVKYSSTGELPELGAISVLLETGTKEITSLLVGANGTIYATAIGSKQDPLLAGSNALQNAKSMETPDSARGSALYRILPDDSAEEMWVSHDDIIYAAGLSPDGGVLLGVGNRGLVLKVEDQNVFASLAAVNSGQVTGMIAQADGKVLLCTANPGKIYTLGPDVSGEGTFESAIFDAKVPARWGKLTWVEDGNGATNNETPASFFVRCGSTSNPEDNWVPWQGPYQNGQTVQCPISRFAQWRVVCSSKVPGIPMITGVNLAYLPRNIRPVMDEIVLQTPGIEVQSSSWSAGESKPATLLRPGIQVESSVFAQPSPVVADNLQGTVHKGFQSVLWSAHDDNEDDLTFAIYYRARDNGEWVLLNSDITQRGYSWQTDGMPDGTYQLKIVASDELSNPPSDALQSERISEFFNVDNTPPSLSDIRLEGVGASRNLSFAATDARSIISRAEFSIDSGKWRIAFPDGLLSDAKSENYNIPMTSLDAREHVVNVRVYDELQNVVTASKVIRIPPEKPSAGTLP